jgi:chromosome segregation ATPase
LNHAISELIKDRTVLERELKKQKFEREEKVLRIEVIDRNIPDLEKKMSEIDEALALIKEAIGEIAEKGVIA